MSRRSVRVCNAAGCPELTDHSSGKCAAHRSEAHRAADARRGSTSERGYGTDHQKLKACEARRVNAGGVRCGRGARCLRAVDGVADFIHPGEPWDLGHDDNDRTRYTGPEHRACNRATKGR